MKNGLSFERSMNAIVSSVYKRVSSAGSAGRFTTSWPRIKGTPPSSSK